MEINLRPMMWHRVGWLTGVPLVKLIYDYYLEGITLKHPIYNQSKTKRIHYVLLIHEIPNILFRKGSLKTFIHTLKEADTISWGVFDKNDIKPSVIAFKILTKRIIVTCLNKLKRQ